MAAWRDDVVDALRSIGGFGNLEQIYAAVAQVRAEPPPPSWHAIVRRELEYNSSDSESFQGRHDLFFSVDGIGGGRWGLRSQIEGTPLAADLSEPPARREQTVYRVLRDTALAKLIKDLHKNTCQICGKTLELSDGKTYSEAHHIKPLGAPHNGPDVAANILVLCPNHHALCDFGAIHLNGENLLEVDGHSVGQNFLDYHNNSLFKQTDNLGET